MVDFEIPGMGTKVAVFGPKEGEKYGSQGWSLKGLQCQEDAEKTNISKGLFKVLRDLQVEKAFAPHVAPASAQIAEIRDLKEEISLGKGISLYRNSGIPTDGIFLGKGHAFVMSGAGCPIIIARSGRHIAVAHAGRDSLIDRGTVVGEPTRESISVVYSLIEAFMDRGIGPEEVEMGMLFSIPVSVFGHDFDHKEHGEFNLALSMFIEDRWPESGSLHREDAVYPSLEGIFLSQAKEVGVQNAWTGHSLAGHQNLAHTRDGKSPARRNLIVVKRTS